MKSKNLKKVLKNVQNVLICFLNGRKETLRNAPYASKLLKGHFEFVDCLGRVVFTIADIGDCNVVYCVRQHDYSFPRPGSEWWIKWLDPVRRRIFIVPVCPRGKGMELTFNEWFCFFDTSVRRVLHGDCRSSSGGRELKQKQKPKER